ncbi:MAG: hypothetical protein GY778_16090 [bacterium]|nr:hypothetical protein [bacterium]
MNTLPTLLAQTSEPEVQLTIGGTVIMTLCIAMVLGLCAFCFRHVLREDQPTEHHHAPADVDTGDLDD